MILWTALALAFLGIGGSHGHRTVDLQKKDKNVASMLFMLFASLPLSIMWTVGFRAFGVYCALKAIPLWVQYIGAF